VKSSGKKWSAAVIVLLLAFLAATIIWPEIRYKSALPKYKFGATAKALERETGNRIEVRKNGNYLPDGTDDLNKRRHFCYEASVSGDFVQLDFNDFHELIAITKTTPLAKLGIHERGLHSMFNLPAE
jgi:hypothetical protein